jgi:L-alanine-DL-glutamate epimerase-like enolase superfamily enzyme
VTTSLAQAVRCEYPVEAVDVRAYKIPTDGPESDGTLEWDSTTLVYVEVKSGNLTGIGYTYADVATAKVVQNVLAGVITGKDAMQTGRRWSDMCASIRNLGRDGITSMAIAAVDVALWDFKGKALGVPVCALLGQTRKAVPIYGSGGFTSYSVERLCDQLSGWVADGIPRVKMKIGRDPDADIERISAARAAIGERAQLFVDANGAYSRKQALQQAQRFSDSRVSWYEEPVYHQDFEGLCQVRAGASSAMEIASGEYGYGLYHFSRMLEAQTVDVLQADATRCAGFSGLLAVDGLCQARLVPLSTHCAPYVHLHAAAACKQLRHMEYFFDHVRIERMLFDGARAPVDGCLEPDLGRPGIGLEFKRSNAERYAL